jgi:hypothetical protein
MEIERLAATYTLAVDSGDYSRLDSIWSNNAVLRVPSGVEVAGRAAILDRIKSQDVRRIVRENAVAAGREPTAVSRHHLTTRHLAPSGVGRIDAFLYYLVITDAGLDHAGTYEDTYVRTDAGWAIAQRHIRLEFVAPNSYYDFLRQWVQPPFTPPSSGSTWIEPRPPVAPR